MLMKGLLVRAQERLCAACMPCVGSPKKKSLKELTHEGCAEKWPAGMCLIAFHHEAITLPLLGNSMVVPHGAVRR
jgi:hypothetical protein